MYRKIFLGVVCTKTREKMSLKYQQENSGFYFCKYFFQQIFLHCTKNKFTKIDLKGEPIAIVSISWQYISLKKDTR